LKQVVNFKFKKCGSKTDCHVTASVCMPLFNILLFWLPVCSRHCQICCVDRQFYVKSMDFAL